MTRQTYRFYFCFPTTFQGIQFVTSILLTHMWLWYTTSFWSICIDWILGKAVYLLSSKNSNTFQPHNYTTFLNRVAWILIVHTLKCTDTIIITVAMAIRHVIQVISVRRLKPGSISPKRTEPDLTCLKPMKTKWTIGPD